MRGIINRFTLFFTFLYVKVLKITPLTFMSPLNYECEWCYLLHAVIICYRLLKRCGKRVPNIGRKLENGTTLTEVLLFGIADADGSTSTDFHACTRLTVGGFPPATCLNAVTGNTERALPPDICLDAVSSFTKRALPPAIFHHVSFVSSPFGVGYTYLVIIPGTSQPCYTRSQTVIPTWANCISQFNRMNTGSLLPFAVSGPLPASPRVIMVFSIIRIITCVDLYAS